MSILRKLLFLALISISIFTTITYACGGGSEGAENGGDDGLAALLGNKKAQAGLGWNFEPVSQDETGISGDTLDINDIDPMTLAELKQQMKDDIKNGMYWSDINSKIWRLLGGVAETGRLASKGTVIASAISIAILAAHPEALSGLGGLFATAEGLSPVAQTAWGLGFSGASTAAKSTTEMFTDGKSAKQVVIDTTKAVIQSAIVGKMMPKSDVGSNLLDAALGEVDTTKQGPAHFDGLKDYGPGYATTATGQKMMK